MFKKPISMLVFVTVLILPIMLPSTVAALEDNKGQITGRVTDWINEPLANVCVIIYNDTGYVAFAYTDKDGYYHTDASLSGGKYTVEFLKEHYKGEFYDDKFLRADADKLNVFGWGSSSVANADLQPDIVGDGPKEDECLSCHTPQVSTLVGSNILVDYSGENLIFESVTQEGMTRITTTNSAPSAPDGFHFLSKKYEINTTALFSGTIKVTLPYNSSEVTGKEADLRLFHFEDGAWKDVTVSVDIVNHKITGEVTSLSPFGIGEPDPAPKGYSAYWLILTTISLTIIGGYILLLHRKEAIA